MKFSLLELTFAVAIFAIGLAFYLHVTSTRRETESFKKSVRHELMSFEFETKYATLKNSFLRGPYECSIIGLKSTREDSKGTYEFACTVSRRDGELMTGQDFRYLLLPILDGYRIDPYKHWTVNTDWELESSIDTMKQKSWSVEFNVEYSFHKYGSNEYP